MFALREPYGLFLWSLWKDVHMKGQDSLFAPQMSVRVTAAFCDGMLRLGTVSLGCAQGYERVLGLSQQFWGTAPEGLGQTVLLAVASFPLEIYFRWCLGGLSMNYYVGTVGD